MTVTPEEIRQIARLARLRLVPDEIAAFAEQFNSMLGHMSVLQEVDVSELQAMGGAAEGRAPFRSTDAAPDQVIGEIGSLAPDWEASFFGVPLLPGLEPTRLAEPTTKMEQGPEPASGPTEADRRGPEAASDAE